MFKDVDLQCFPNLFCASAFQFRFYFLNRAAKRVVFSTANANCAETYRGKIGFLRLKVFIERGQVVRNVSGAVR